MRPLSLIWAAVLAPAAFAIGQPQIYRMTKPAPPSDCSAAIANPPPAYTTFSTTDAAAYLWFYVTGMELGEVVATEYYTPSGQYYTPISGTFDPVSRPGTWCFADLPLDIASHPPASLPGQWTVKVKDNGVLLFTLTFTISTGNTSGVPTGYNHNLIQNGNAEGSTANSDCSPSAAPPAYWSMTGQFTVCSYGSPGYPSATSPGPPNRSKNFFFGGFTGKSAAIQTIDVSWAATDIDRGMALFTLSGYLGGFESQDDNVVVRAVFKGTSTAIGNPQTIGPVYASDRNGVTGLLLRTVNGAVPVGTRQIDIVQEITRNSGSANDGYADDLSLVLTFGSACTFQVSPLSQGVGVSGASETAQVAAASGCVWTATSGANWITVTAGASGSGNGTVAYRVAANTSSTSRTGTLTIAGKTLTVTQDAACTYSLTPASYSMPAGGGSASIRLTTGDACAWAAASSVSWLSLTSPASGKGTASISFTVAANGSTASRTGTLTAAGQTFTVTQTGLAVTGSSPMISEGGIVQAASNRAGTIARGSLFTIYGKNLGPSSYLQANEYPIPETLGGVVVTFTNGPVSRHAYLTFVSALQINAILPSDMPVGNARVTVSYDGSVSASVLASVVDTEFGIFSTAGGVGPGIVQTYLSPASAPLNTPSAPAMPGQIGILWGTGLGATTAVDNMPPAGGDLAAPVEVRLGGKLAKKLYSGRAPGFAGVDNIYFEVPADVPVGCSVPVQVKAGSAWSNSVRMAISADGKRCADPGNPIAAIAANGGRIGLLSLLRVGLTSDSDPSQPPLNVLLDLGLGLFGEARPMTDFSFNPLVNLPPAGTCSSTLASLELGSLLSTLTAAFDASSSHPLDAGPNLVVKGPNGQAHLLPDGSSGSPYVAFLGGTIPMDGTPSLPLFLEPGTYSIAGSGGSDIGAFSTSFTLPAPITWTNRAQVTAIDRAAGTTLSWTGGDPAQIILILGAAANSSSGKSGGFLCVAPEAAGTFFVPPWSMAELPPADSAVLGLTALPMANIPRFTAPGLDYGLVLDGTVLAKTVLVR